MQNVQDLSLPQKIMGGFAKGGKGKGKGGKGKGKSFEPEGPPDRVEAVGTVSHTCEDQLILKCTNVRVPQFNARIFLENKEEIGRGCCWWSEKSGRVGRWVDRWGGTGRWVRVEAVGTVSHTCGR